jgi:RNA polymerase sigma-70 factor (ECF subfamily)
VVVVVLHLVEGRAREIHLISNPEKLTAIGRL